MSAGSARAVVRLSFALALVLVTSEAFAVTITQPPQVNIAPYQVTIWWGTDVSSSTEVHYGLVSQANPAAYSNHSVWSPPAGTRHSRTLCNLAPGTYFYRAQSTDAAASSTFSQEGTFTVPVPTTGVLDGFVLDRSVTAMVNVGSTVYLGGTF